MLIRAGGELPLLHHLPHCLGPPFASFVELSSGWCETAVAPGPSCSYVLLINHVLPDGTRDCGRKQRWARCRRERQSLAMNCTSTPSTRRRPPPATRPYWRLMRSRPRHQSVLPQHTALLAPRHTAQPRGGLRARPSVSCPWTQGLASWGTSPDLRP